MCSTKTRLLDFDRIKLKGEDAHIVIKLMMACNDMSLANNSLTLWRSDTYKVHSGRWFKSTPTTLAIWLPEVAYALRNLQIQTSAHFSANLINIQRTKKSVMYEYRFDMTVMHVKSFYWSFQPD
jgi:hypothetical protein